MSRAMTDTKYPHIQVRLSGEDGNAFFIIGHVRTALRSAKVPTEDIDAFSTEAMSGNYDNVLQTCKRWVNCS